MSILARSCFFAIFTVSIEWCYGDYNIYINNFAMVSDSLKVLTTSAVAVGASEVAPSVLDTVTSDPSQLSQIVTQVLILALAIFKLFKKKQS